MERRSRPPAQQPVALSKYEQQLIDASTWPLHFFSDEHYMPRVAGSKEEFLNELLVGDYLEDIVVLPHGTDLLGLSESEALPEWLPQALGGSATVLEFLKKLDVGVLGSHKAALEYVDDWGVQREAMPLPYPFCLWGVDAATSGVPAEGALPEAWRSLGQRLSAVEALVAKGDVNGSQVYACEMRLLREREANKGATKSHQPGVHGSTKSLCLKHARDVVKEQARWTLYWNCYDDGLFVGGRGCGKGLHVDQVLWSNVGKHWRGHKLIVVWPAGEVSARMVAEMGDARFCPPLGPKHLAALKESSCIALLRPGDVFLFSGGVAHATLCVSDELTVSAYESLVTLQPSHVRHFMGTGSSCGPGALDRGVMEACDVQDFRAGVARHVSSLLQSGALAGQAADSSCVGLHALLLRAARLLMEDCAYAELLAPVLPAICAHEEQLGAAEMARLPSSLAPRAKRQRIIDPRQAASSSSSSTSSSSSSRLEKK